MNPQFQVYHANGVFDIQVSEYETHRFSSRIYDDSPEYLLDFSKLIKGYKWKVWRRSIMMKIRDNEYWKKLCYWWKNNKEQRRRAHLKSISEQALSCMTVIPRPPMTKDDHDALLQRRADRRRRDEQAEESLG